MTKEEYLEKRISLLENVVDNALNIIKYNIPEIHGLLHEWDKVENKLIDEYKNAITEHTAT